MLGALRATGRRALAGGGPGERGQVCGQGGSAESAGSPTGQGWPAAELISWLTKLAEQCGRQQRPPTTWGTGCCPGHPFTTRSPGACIVFVPGLLPSDRQHQPPLQATQAHQGELKQRLARPEHSWESGKGRKRRQEARTRARGSGVRGRKQAWGPGSPLWL